METMLIAAFERQVDDLLRATRGCLEQGLLVPALMLAYATIDGMAWCVRANPDGSVIEADFENWVETYIFQGSSSGALKAVDLYGARCAMLHSQIAESRKSKQAIAREVHYRRKDGSGLVPVYGLNTPEHPVMVDIDVLVDAVEYGVRKFREAIAADPLLRAQVARSASKYLRAVCFRS